MDKITVYDQDNQRVGETYQRRAKQLVLKNRAKWMDDEFSAICLIDEMEEEEMTYQNNGEMIETHDMVEEEAPNKPSDDLLMYLAERNVRFRQNLIYHIAAFFPALFLVGVFTNSFHSRHNGELFAGMFLAWGILIAYKMVVMLRSWLTSRMTGKHSPVTAEFERLKSIHPDKLSYEYKRL